MVRRTGGTGGGAGRPAGVGGEQARRRANGQAGSQLEHAHPPTPPHSTHPTTHTRTLPPTHPPPTHTPKSLPLNSACTCPHTNRSHVDERALARGPRLWVFGGRGQGNVPEPRPLPLPHACSMSKSAAGVQARRTGFTLARCEGAVVARARQVSCEGDPLTLHAPETSPPRSLLQCRVHAPAPSQPRCSPPRVVPPPPPPTRGPGSAWGAVRAVVPPPAPVALAEPGHALAVACAWGGAGGRAVGWAEGARGEHRRGATRCGSLAHTHPRRTPTPQAGGAHRCTGWGSTFPELRRSRGPNSRPAWGQGRAQGAEGMSRENTLLACSAAAPALPSAPTPGDRPACPPAHSCTLERAPPYHRGRSLAAPPRAMHQPARPFPAPDAPDARPPAHPHPHPTHHDAGAGVV